MLLHFTRRLNVRGAFLTFIDSSFMAALPRNVILYGRQADLPETVPLRAGPLSLLFEAGDLRYVRFGDHEILRRVYVAVRDRNWATIPMRTSDLNIDAADDRFTITYSADHQEREIDFHWAATIQGTADGRISFAMQGQARSTFLRNRIGFCVLHPPQCGSLKCRVVQAQGDTIEKEFPRLISPAPKEDPFQEIRSMSYSITDRLHVDLQFEGDVFETEDQRNWSDGSYKTFCTPLRLPFPAKIEAGTEISQRIELVVRGDDSATSIAPAAPATVRLHVQDRAAPLLRFGLCLSDQPHTERQIARLRALQLSHLRIDLQPSAPSAAKSYRRQAQLAWQIGAPLEIALHLQGNANLPAQIDEVARWIDPNDAIARWLVFQTGETTTRPEALDTTRRVLQSRTPHAEFGGGSAAYFTELNRDRPDLPAADVLCYSVNPQVHAFDNTSLIENAHAIAYTVESARALAAGRGVAVSPITLRPRFNPDATGDAAEPAPDTLPDNVDPRQMSLFGAAWTLASLHALAESGAASATYYETLGWLGVIERDKGSPAPDSFPSISGGVFPLYHVFAAVAEFRDGEVRVCDSTEPLHVVALVLHKANRVRTLIANLTPHTQRITLGGLPPGIHAVCRLNESNALEAMQQPEAFLARPAQTLASNTDGLELELEAYEFVSLTIATR
jgi:hypothetical protein